ncbi:hypothetical protein V6N12_055931 [Hibiscus sabdariffa]|uniref:Uncharacterized protein n=1 Tax=Hibiscus sabdariffa TaxID=183260 RepID=A0ABR2CR01_9ROSI
MAVLTGLQSIDSNHFVYFGPLVKNNQVVGLGMGGEMNLRNWNSDCPVGSEASSKQESAAKDYSFFFTARDNESFEISPNHAGAGASICFEEWL